MSAQAFSSVWRMETLRGKKAWISGEDWPMRDWMSKMDIPGSPDCGRRPRPKTLIGKEYA